jgi:hypothetical protein
MRFDYSIITNLILISRFELTPGISEDIWFVNNGSKAKVDTLPSLPDDYDDVLKIHKFIKRYGK